MKKILITTVLSFLFGARVFSQGPNAGMINTDDNLNDSTVIQTNLGNQRANPPAQEQFSAVNFSAQSSGTVSGSTENNNPGTKVPCKDCDAVKQALKAAHHSGSGSGKGKSFNLKRTGYIFSERTKIKMKKVFSHRKKIRTTYEVCFNWN